MTIKSVTEQSEVQSIISDLFYENTFLSVAIGQHEQIKCEIDLFDTQAESIKVKLRNTKKKYVLKQNGEYSFSAHGRDGEIYEFVARCIEDGAIQAEIQIPNEIQVTEQRAHKRFCTSKMNNPFIELETSHGSFTLVLQDLSQGGISFLVPKHLEEYFCSGDTVKIWKMGAQVFNDALELEVLHKAEITEGTRNSVKVGGQFV